MTAGRSRHGAGCGRDDGRDFSVWCTACCCVPAVHRVAADHGRLCNHLAGSRREVANRIRRLSLSNPRFQAIAKYNEVLAAFSGSSRRRHTVARSRDFSQVFGIQPILGRDFNANDAKREPADRSGQLGYWSSISAQPGSLATRT